jgi:hypothetical protein
MKRSAPSTSVLPTSALSKAALSNIVTEETLELLGDMLYESYTTSYKTSSLKVRRRYRVLLAAPEAERQQRELASAFASEKPSTFRFDR